MKETNPIKDFEIFLNESVDTTTFEKGDVIEVVTIFGRGIEELKDVEKKYIGKLYIVDKVIDNEAIQILGGGSWMIDDIRKLSNTEVEKRKKEIDKIYSDYEKDRKVSKIQNQSWLKNHINTFKQYLKDKEFELDEQEYDLSNDNYEIKLSVKKKII